VGLPSAPAPAALYCLERETRRIVWTFDDNGKMQPMYSSPCLAEGRIYIGEGMHGNYVCKLHCIDAGTGRKAWESTTADHIDVASSSAASGVSGIFLTANRRCWARGPQPRYVHARPTRPASFISRPFPSLPSASGLREWTAWCSGSEQVTSGPPDSRVRTSRALSRQTDFNG
jgi:hypothetical protein